MRQQTQIVWDLYLSSVKKIVLTTLEIIRQRINPYKAASRHAWNSRPGVFFVDTRGRETDHVCVVINTVSDVPVLSSGSNIFKIIKSVGQAECVKEVVVNWETSSTPPPLADWFRFGAVKDSRLDLKIFRTNQSSLQQFKAAESCSSDNILSLDDDVTIAAQEVMFAHSVYKDFPDRLIGFSPRSHFWDGETKAWRYTSKPATHFSMVSLNAAMYRKKYAAAFNNFLSRKTISYVEEVPHCRDILVNFLVAHITKKAPIKVTQRKRLSSVLNPDKEARIKEFEQKHECFSRLVSDFGEMPLIQSQIRMDPVLFKDPVSNLRKKYRTMETL